MDDNPTFDEQTAARMSTTVPKRYAVREDITGSACLLRIILVQPSAGLGGDRPYHPNDPGKVHLKL
jgi:hypothetical protein